MIAKHLASYIKDYIQTPGNAMGGNCHVVLADYNFRNSDIEFCLNVCREQKDILGIFIMEQLLLMRKTARYKAIDSAWADIFGLKNRG